LRRETALVSKYIEFLVAPSDSAAAAVRNRGPGRRYAVVDANDICLDADDAVFALPDELVTNLVEASLVRLREVAEVWVAVVVAEGTEIDVDAATVLISRIAELARAATDTRDRLYCWVAC
jgi:hypothetical protein